MWTVQNDQTFEEQCNQLIYDNRNNKLMEGDTNISAIELITNKLLGKYYMLLFSHHLIFMYLSNCI